MWMTGTPMPQDVCSFARVSGRTIDGETGSPWSPARTSPDSRLERHSIDFGVAADRHVVDGDPGVLAQQIARAFGHRDVLDHRAQHGFGSGAGLARRAHRSPA
jgi:hypothetical protein